MKKTFLYTIFFSMALTSCLEDKGNYDYTPLPDVEISGINESLRCVLQEPQKLRPVVKTTIPETQLEYCWRIAADTLAKTKDFDYTFKNVPVSNDPLVFEVRDKQTNVRYSRAISLQVVSPFTTGWALLTDNNGQAVLSFQSLEGDALLYSDVYKEVNGQALEGNPVGVKQLVYTDGFTGQRKDRISIIMQGGKSPELDGVSLIRQKFYDDEFHISPVPSFAFISADYYSQDNALNIITTDGQIYGKAVGSMGTPDDGYYQYPFGADDKGYDLVPMLTTVAQQGIDVSFDRKNHRFVRWTPTKLSSTISDVNFNESSSIKNVDLKFFPGTALWMGNARWNYDGYMYAVLKDGSKYTLCQLYFGYDYSVYDFIFKLTAMVELPAGMVNDNSVFAVNPSTPYLFVGTGSQLKAINLQSLNDIDHAVNDLTTYDGDIKGLLFSQDNQLLPNLELSMAVSKGNTSSIYLVDPTLTAHGKIVKRYDGIKGRVVSFCRKIM